MPQVEPTLYFIVISDLPNPAAAEKKAAAKPAALPAAKAPASPAANGPAVVGAPVTLGGQHVRPGEIIVGDADGVAVANL